MFFQNLDRCVAGLVPNFEKKGMLRSETGPQLFPPSQPSQPCLLPLRTHTR
jgi:hypothetical protein